MTGARVRRTGLSHGALALGLLLIGCAGRTSCEPDSAPAVSSFARASVERGERYWRTKCETDRAAWIEALDCEGHDFGKRYTPDYGPRGVYKFNTESRLACFVITKEIAERLGGDAFEGETPDGTVRFEWKRRDDGAIEYSHSSPTNWEVYVKVWRAAEPERNPKPEANVRFWTPFPQRVAVAFEIAHHRPDWAAGPYASVPFPTNEIRAVDNFAFALREAFPLLGFERAEAFDGTLWVGSFDSNFPNGHPDFPPHFHLTANCRDGLQVHHYYPRGEDGRLTSDCFQDMSNVIDVWDRAVEFRPGDEFPYYDGHGKVALRVKMLEGGTGLELSTPDGKRRVRVESVRPCEKVLVREWKDEAWVDVRAVDVKDDPFAGVMETPEGVIRYDPASGKRIDDATARMKTLRPPFETRRLDSVADRRRPGEGVARERARAFSKGIRQAGCINRKNIV